ncbi:hypothetical protein QFC20_005789 [Naganishia adeliensis]|uniref:Uncharacterized protein n=1 Tax=Naganishia adeliensis TaxID=92952 RepID=A0ACC2VJP0_9TREE|nr:hypothetical protein QFC20_005789 [Naganishia adeliensis]
MTSIEFKGFTEESLTASVAHPTAKSDNGALNELELKDMFNDIEDHMMPLLKCRWIADFSSAWYELRYRLLNRSLDKEEGAVKEWVQHWKKFLTSADKLFGKWLRTGLPPDEYGFGGIDIIQLFECWMCIPSSVLGSRAQQRLNENSERLKQLREKTAKAKQKAET